MGTLRFLLAFLVAFSHMQLIQEFHLGVLSVIIFYLIAGYVMTHSFTHNFKSDLRNAGYFYIDRFFRVYPLYILSVVLIIVFCKTSGYGILHLNIHSLLLNATIFPLNTVSGTANSINPPTWSLATELQFYLLLPFLIKYRSLKYILIPMSYIIYICASFGVLNTNLWGYRLLPGTLFIFLIGSLLYDAINQKEKNKYSSIFIKATAIVSIVHIIVLSFFDHIKQPYILEETIGLLVGILILLFVSNAVVKDKKIDNYLGQLSYPLFLGHTFILYLFDYLKMNGLLNIDIKGMVVLQLCSSLVVCFLLSQIDTMIQKYRKKIQMHFVSSKNPKFKENNINMRRKTVI